MNVEAMDCGGMHLAAIRFGELSFASLANPRNSQKAAVIRSRRSAGVFPASGCRFMCFLLAGDAGPRLLAEASIIRMKNWGRLRVRRYIAHGTTAFGGSDAFGGSGTVGSLPAL